MKQAYCPICKKTSSLVRNSEELKFMCEDCGEIVKYPEAAHKSAYLLLNSINKKTKVPFWGYITVAIFLVSSLFVWLFPYVLPYAINYFRLTYLYQLLYQ
ncbi:MAG: hypothetical protein HN353_01305 [Bdellovibrionales bacterium]|nr:hypothetical protein [Bdellovibrionales bacterium]MBT3526694.1 hypothetical protein [Bdellovibrionales bacterium]MBT7668462.1 hypothetical protein [Bdellovibrionales bacterium]MBT7765651.1 hypothetical protein [Bdellovibrionales bacterium]